MFKLFKKDLLDRQRIIKYLIYAVLVYALLDGYLKDKEDFEINSRFLLFISLALIGSMFYYIRGYVGNDRILSYYALPASKKDVNLNFILAVIIDIIFSKLLLVYIASYLFKAPFDIYIKLAFLTLVSLCLALASNALSLKRVHFILIGLASIASIYIIIKFNLFYGGLATVLILILSVFLLKDTYFSTNTNAKISKISMNNYFLKFSMAENIYIINTVCILLMVGFAIYFMPAPMGIVIASAVGAVNTPLLTMFSSSEGLRDYDKMFPNSEISLRTNYRKLLSIYFVLINLFISILAYNKINSSYLLVANMIIISIIEIFVSYWLEIKKAITNTKTQNEIWKHPRKYILPIIVFFISFLILVIVK
ncbi:MAG: hypothetical protein E7D92_02315 [Anaerococcus sp.]|uniref:hypothetical protein n=1 Tax=Anaerococcus sp. TaxID=1872515 RepID=UPI00290032D2|nr:hypothetical protein [Anaerococcus sp.]MDU2353414.1 hypothetical protein [Anaerococcus sp.]